MRRPAAQQSGAALIVALVLLLVLTLLAVSTMRSATLELLMAGNAQNRENAFRLAEAAIADATAQAEAQAQAVDGWSVDIGPQGLPGLRGDYQATIRYLGRGLPYTGGFSPDDYEFNYFQVDATGRTDRGARSQQAQGLVRVGRKATE